VSFEVAPQQETGEFGQEVESIPQFLTPNGKYLLAKTNEAQIEMPFTEAHRRLVPLGSFMLVKTRALSHFGLNGPKKWVRGSLRYPEDDHTDDNALCVYVTVVVKTRPGTEMDIRVVHVPPEQCLILENSGVRDQDFTTEVIKQNVQMPMGR